MVADRRKYTFKVNLCSNVPERANSYQIAILLLLLILMLTNTNHTLEKLENLLKAAEYKVRYEKGNFKTNACLLQNSRMIVVNKFSNLESKIQAVTELIRQLEIDVKRLDDKQLGLLNQIKQTELEL